jgi:hypothetical protein
MTTEIILLNNPLVIEGNQGSVDIDLSTVLFNGLSRVLVPDQVKEITHDDFPEKLKVVSQPNEDGSISNPEITVYQGGEKPISLLDLGGHRKLLDQEVVYLSAMQPFLILARFAESDDADSHGLKVYGVVMFK